MNEEKETTELLFFLPMIPTSIHQISAGVVFFHLCPLSQNSTLVFTAWEIFALQTAHL